MNNRQWRAIADDKILFSTLICGLGFRIPKPYALYCRIPRIFNDVPCIVEPAAMANFVLRKIPYPFFAKPIRGFRGEGAWAVVRREDEFLVTRQEKRIQVHDFVASFRQMGKGGYIFQECLAPHPTIREICGDSLSTIRMIMLLADERPASDPRRLENPANVKYHRQLCARHIGKPDR